MDTRLRIIEKAGELFYRYGVRSVSMDDIASQLGMSKKTLYQYHADKDELVTAVIEGLLQYNKTACMDSHVKGENPVHEVFLSFQQLFTTMEKMNPSLIYDLQKYHAAAYQRFLQFRNHFLYEMVSDNLKRGVEQGLYREDIDVDILTRFRLHNVLLCMNAEVFPNNRNKLMYIEEQLAEHFLYGLVTAKGQKLIQKYKSQRTKKPV